MIMSKQTEDTMYAIYEEVEKLGLRKEFEKQIKKMQKQSQWKWKTICEKQEYALRRIKE
jgi:hypothetical protein